MKGQAMNVMRELWQEVSVQGITKEPRESVLDLDALYAYCSEGEIDVTFDGTTEGEDEAGEPALAGEGFRELIGARTA
jgi:hypothetical protein